jgi:hypothetical protein
MRYDVATQSSYGLAGAIIVEGAMRRLTREGRPILTDIQANQLATAVADNIRWAQLNGSPLVRFPSHHQLGPEEASFFVGDGGTHPLLDGAAQTVDVQKLGPVTTTPGLWLVTRGDYQLRAPGAPDPYGGVELFSSLSSALYVQDHSEVLGGFLRGAGVDLSQHDLGPLPEPPREPQPRQPSRIEMILNQLEPPSPGDGL